MALKFALLLSALASARAGFSEPSWSVAAPATFATHSSNVLRSADNLAQISTYSKSLGTPYSALGNSNFRLSGPAAAAIYSPPFAYAPALSYAAAPAAALLAKPALAEAYLPYGAPAPAYLAKPSAIAPAPLSYAKAALAATPLAYAPQAPVASPGHYVAHTAFTGLGASYAY